MNCTEFHHRIQEMRPEEDGCADAGLCEHLVYCSACRNIWESQSVVLEATRAWQQQPLPEIDMADRVLYQLSRESLPIHATTREMRHDLMSRIVPRPSPKRGMKANSFAAASVGVLAAVVCLFVWGGDGTTRLLLEDSTATSLRGPSTQPAEVAATFEGAEPSAQPATTQPAIDDLVRDAGSAYLVLAQETAGAMRDVSLVISSSELDAAGLELSSLRGESPLDWIGIWKERITPPPDSVWSALDFLWKELSNESPSAT